MQIEWKLILSCSGQASNCHNQLNIGFYNFKLFLRVFPHSLSIVKLAIATLWRPTNNSEGSAVSSHAAASVSRCSLRLVAAASESHQLWNFCLTNSGTCNIQDRLCFSAQGAWCKSTPPHSPLPLSTIPLHHPGPPSVSTPCLLSLPQSLSLWYCQIFLSNRLHFSLGST